MWWVRNTKLEDDVGLFVCLFVQVLGKKNKEFYVHTWVSSLNGCSFFGWFFCSGPKEKNKKLYLRFSQNGCRFFWEREREVLKLGLPKSSFVCFLPFQEGNPTRVNVVTYFELLARQLIAPPFPMIWLQNSSDMYEGPAKGHMTIKLFPHF
jgi:hypothetical protein